MMPNVCLAYIGPGAGFAFLGSFFILLTAIVLAVASVLTFPLRAAYALVFRRRRTGRPLARRVVVVGLDGMDPQVATRLMERGDLPALNSLRNGGTFAPLGSTCPPISPVAWSSFATGVNPGKHNIFDFLGRDLRSYRPELSSTRITTTGVSRARWWRPATEIELRRKSKPFWTILGEHGVFSTVLRVPITFPPEPFRGLLLSGMCVPDLRGTQGSFTLFDSAAPQGTGEFGVGETGESGLRIRVTVGDGRIRTALPGPPAGEGRLSVPLDVRLGRAPGAATVRVSGQRLRLQGGTYSDWVRVSFRQGWRQVHGICKFLLLATAPEFRLYVTPIHIDPERPAMPVSHPRYYSTYLAKLHGPFATLGLSEDTSALSEGVIDNAAFLKQTYDIHGEREAMFFDALKRVRRGLCCCVFDATDRIQHMFFGCPDPTAVEDVYRRSDALVGRVLKSIDDQTVVFVVSDHGFTSFRRSVHLNAWLAREGFLTIKPGGADADYLSGVDWEKTVAYGFGLSGIYLNVKGREARGVVAGDEARRDLKRDIAQRLSALVDPASGERAIRTVYDAEEVYHGPYRDNGPDLIVGYEAGYRVSWETATGKAAGEVFADNTKAWSGDHCVDRERVPGVFFCNRKVDLTSGPPQITDLAPTILHLMGINKPAHMDGKVLHSPLNPDTLNPGLLDQLPRTEGTAA